MSTQTHFQSWYFRDLLVTVSSSHAPSWNDEGSGARTDGAFWRPAFQVDGWLRPLGCVVTNHWGDLNGRWGTLLVGDAGAASLPTRPYSGEAKYFRREQARYDELYKGQPPVNDPVDYELVWSDSGSGAKRDVSIWRPIAPYGYVACGDVASDTKPGLRRVWCLREDLAENGLFKALPTWTTDGTGADRPASFWDVIPPAVASDDPYLPTFAGTFRFSGNISSPPDQSLAKVPRFWMFRLNEVPTHPPTVGLDNIPESHYETSPLVVGSIVLPYTALLEGNDPVCVNNLNPWCIIDKNVSWRVVFKQVNRTSAPQEVSRTQATVIKQPAASNVGLNFSTERGVFLTKYGVSLNFPFSAPDAKSRESTTKASTVPANSVTLAWARVVSLECRREFDGSSIGENVVYSQDIRIVNLPLPPS